MAVNNKDQPFLTLRSKEQTQIKRNNSKKNIELLLIIPKKKPKLDKQHTQRMSNKYKLKIKMNSKLKISKVIILKRNGNNMITKGTINNNNNNNIMIKNKLKSISNRELIINQNNTRIISLAITNMIIVSITINIPKIIIINSNPEIETTRKEIMSISKIKKKAFQIETMTTLLSVRLINFHNYYLVSDNRSGYSQKAD